MATTISTDSPKLTANIADHADVYGGRGLNFDGATDYLLSDDNGNAMGMGSNPYSISAWVKVADATNNQTYTYFSACSVGSSQPRFLLQVTTLSGTNSLKAVYEKSAGNLTVSIDEPMDTEWHHLVFVEESNTSRKFYKDGELVGTDTTNYQTDTGYVDYVMGNARTINQWFDGSMSDVKLFNTALSLEQIQELYLKPEQSAPSAVQDNLVIWYPMCEGNPDSPQSIVYDHSEKKLGTSVLKNPLLLSHITAHGGNTEELLTDGTFKFTRPADGGSIYGVQFWFSTNSTNILEKAPVTGELYKLSFNGYYDGGGSQPYWYLFGQSSGDVTITPTTTPTDYEIYFTGSGAVGRFQANTPSIGQSVYIKDFEIKPVLMGNHATTNFFGDERMVNGDASSASPDPPTFTDRDGTAISHSSYQTTWSRHTNTLDGAAQSWKVTHSGSDSAMFPRFVVNADGNYTGKTLKVSVDVLLQSGQASDVTGLTLRMYSDVSANVLTSVNGNTSTEDSWQTLTGTFIPSDTDSQIDIQITCANGIFAYLNNITVKEVGMSTTGFATAQEEPTIPQIPLLRYNEKMVFDGVDDECYLDLGASALGTSDQTLSAWFNASDLTGTQAIFGAMHYNASSSFGHGIILDGTTLHGSAGGGSTVYDNLTHTVSVNKTYHVAFVRDATNDYYYLYVNGALADSYSSSIDPRFNDTYDTWIIGRAGNASEKAKYFQGIIDECSVFNTAFSATEVQELFNDGVALDATTHSKADYLLGYWRNDGISSWLDRRGWSHLEFDGSNDYIDCGNDSSLQITGALSISAWVKTSTTDFKMIASKDDGGSNRNWHLKTESNGYVRFQLWSGGSMTNSTGDVNIADGGWHHIGVTYNPSTAIKIYVDGVLDENDTSSIASSIDNDSVNFNIGRIASGNYFNGSISSVALYSGEKQSSEILAIYNAGINSSEASNSGLQGYWKLDSASTVIDLSSNSNNGTVSGATLNTGNNGTPAGTPESIIVREGLNSNKDGLGFPFKNDDRNVLRLDGVSEYLLIPKTAGLDMSGGRAFTMSCWFKLESYKSYPMLMSYGDPTTGHEESSLFVHTGNNTIGWGNQHGDADFPNPSGTTISLNTWYMATVTFNGSTTIKIYVNDALDGTKSDCTNVAITHDPIYIGKRATGLPFNGMIDEARVYNRELSLAEIQKNYKHGKGKHKND